MDESRDAEVDLSAVVGVLDDSDCRTILRSLAETPDQSAPDLADSCDLSRTSAYRKVDRLVDADLVRTTTELREDGHHTARYAVSFEGVHITLGDDGEFAVAVDRPETPDERLARFWSTMRDSR